MDDLTAGARDRPRLTARARGHRMVTYSGDLGSEVAVRGMAAQRNVPSGGAVPHA